MWMYEKKLEYPIKIKKPDPRMAKVIMSQYGGPNGEMSASLRYLSQRFAMPDEVTKSVLNDIGTEELSHLEMVGTIVHQLTRDLSEEEIKAGGFADYYVDYGTGIFPVNAAGVPWNAGYINSMSDVIANLTENLAAEQKARTVYDNILRLADDPDVIDVIRFLREREVVHFQRFGEALRHVTDLKDCKKYY